MHALDHYDYAVIRVVPRVEREEFINVGVILSCEASRYLEARIELDEARLRALAPDLDIESVNRHLQAIAASVGAPERSDAFHMSDGRFPACQGWVSPPVHSKFACGAS